MTDNGHGMTPKALSERMSIVYGTGKVATIEGNYGIGARMATLGRNHLGVTWASRTCALTENDDEAIEGEAMVRVARDGAGIYGLQRFDLEDDRRDIVVDPDEGMLGILDLATRDSSGTAVILHGSDPDVDTWEAGSHSEIARSIARRFWRLPGMVWVEFPETPFRRVRPLGEAFSETAETLGAEELEDGTKVHWFILPATIDRPSQYHVAGTRPAWPRCVTASCST